MLLVVIFSAGAAYAINGPFLIGFCPTIPPNYFFLAHELLPSAVVQACINCRAFGALAIFATRKSLPNTSTAKLVSIAIGVFVIVEILLYPRI